jgi:toxin CptA
MTSAPAIGFEYRPSRAFQRVLGGMTALALLALMLTDLALWLQVAVSIIVLLAAWRAVRGMAHSPVVAAGWGDEHRWTVHLASHEDVFATLASHRVLGPFVLLRLKTVENREHALLLAPDNTDADIRRRLRMRLATLQVDGAIERA